MTRVSRRGSRRKGLTPNTHTRCVVHTYTHTYTWGAAYDIETQKKGRTSEREREREISSGVGEDEPGFDPCALRSASGARLLTLLRRKYCPMGRDIHTHAHTHTHAWGEAARTSCIEFQSLVLEIGLRAGGATVGSHSRPRQEFGSFQGRIRACSVRTHERLFVRQHDITPYSASSPLDVGF